MGCEHGGLNYKTLINQNIPPDRIADFSVSVFPDSLPDGLLNKLDLDCLTRYPDPECYELKMAITNAEDVDSMESVLVVNGTSQAIFLMANAFLDHRECVTIIEPTYGEYEEACRLKTDRIHSIKMEYSPAGFTFPIKKIIHNIQGKSPRLLWICSPNNPTGNVLKEEEFCAIQSSCEKSGTILVLDEAYACFLSQDKRYPVFGKTTLVLRSMTKDYGLPGLRLGYIVGDSKLIQQLKRWQPEWSVNGLAQDAGIICFEKKGLFLQKWKEIAERTQKFRMDIEDLGYSTLPSCTNFFLVKIEKDMEELKEYLWSRFLLVRDCASFGLPGYIRIGCNTMQNNQKLIESLEGFSKK